MSRKNIYQSFQNVSEQVPGLALAWRSDGLSILTTEILSTITGLILVLVLIIINAALIA
jgi:hypothetical protein